MFLSFKKFDKNVTCNSSGKETRSAAGDHGPEDDLRDVLPPAGCQRPNAPQLHADRGDVGEAAQRVGGDDLRPHLGE